MQKLIWMNHSKAVLESSPGIDFWNCLKPVWEADWMAPLEIVLSDMPQPFLVHLLRPSVGQVWWRSARPTINTASELVLCFSPTNWICTWGCHGRFSLLFRDVIQKALTRNSWWISGWPMMTQQIGSTCQISNMQQFLARHRCHCLYHRCAPPLQRRSGSTGLSFEFSSGRCVSFCPSIWTHSERADLCTHSLLNLCKPASSLRGWGCLGTKILMHRNIEWEDWLRFAPQTPQEYSKIKGCSPCSVTCVTNKPQARAFWLCHIVPWTPPASGRTISKERFPSRHPLFRRPVSTRCFLEDHTDLHWVGETGTCQGP